jgi:N-acyl-D-aspartate/D-glutamate deacylase
MGEASQDDQRAATPDQLATMQQAICDGLEAGALGMSITRNRNHFDIEGRRISGACAPDEELFAVVDVLRHMGTGVIQCGGGGAAELQDRLVSRLSAACGRRIMYNTITQNARAPEEWARHLALVEETCKAGNQAMPLCTPNQIKQRFNMHNCQTFRGLTHWHPILMGSDAAKMQAYSDPRVRQTLRADLEALGGTNPVFSKRWDLMYIEEPQLPQHQAMRGKTVAQIAAEQGKDPLDAFLDLAVAEQLETVFVLTEINVEPEAVAKILTSPYTIVGLSDGGAHVQFDSGVAFSTRLLGYWVREQQIMSLEEAIRQITFVSASAFGIYGRGLLRPGLAADLVIFDAETIRPLPEDIVHDFPNNGWRIRERAEGIAYTIVNGIPLMEHGHPTGALPGQVIRNALCMA